jgi:3-isopropylmalate/(R)-2-methylmalate dehydratase large subunit
MVARPGDPGNALPLSQLDENVTLDIALGGSCTAGKRADFDAYHEVLKWAVDHRMRVWARTRMYLQYGTRGVRDLRRLASFGELQEQVANGRVR